VYFFHLSFLLLPLLLHLHYSFVHHHHQFALYFCAFSSINCNCLNFCICTWHESKRCNPLTLNRDEFFWCLLGFISIWKKCFHFVNVLRLKMLEVRNNHVEYSHRMFVATIEEFDIIGDRCVAMVGLLPSPLLENSVAVEWSSALTTRVRSQGMSRRIWVLFHNSSCC